MSHVASYRGHPCRGMSATARDAFEALCVGQQPRMARRTVAALLDRGLIQKAGDRTFGSGWSAVKVPVYEVPVPVHMAWCEWCAKQGDGADA